MPQLHSIQKSIQKSILKRLRKAVAFMKAVGLVEYVAAGGVIIDDGKMLLLDRPHRGEIRLPKGHVDPGESHDETALRESVEETGYGDLEIVEDLGERVVEFDSEGRHYRRTEHYYLMRPLSHRQVSRSPKDEKQFRPMWVPMAEAATMLTYLAEQEVASRAVVAYQKQMAESR
jgi:8-oxo-dGTP pyrophosphatase MutT (NUDIX family)